MSVFDEPNLSRQANARPGGDRGRDDSASQHSHGRPARLRRAHILGCPVDRLDMASTVARIDELIAQGHTAQQVSINAAKIVALQQDPQLRQIVEACELISADGQAIVWASRLLGDPLPERVAGIDLMGELLGLAERRGYRIFILGARREVLDRATANIRARHPRLDICGTRDGYFQGDGADVAADVRAAKPHMLFVAMPSPQKEYWLGRYGRSIGVPFIMGVGGSVDVIAGVTRRAPVALQRTGLEWAYRLCQEPGRLLRRYWVTNRRFLVLLARTLIRRHALGRAFL